jgi:hypothetical protein
MGCLRQDLTKNVTEEMGILFFVNRLAYLLNIQMATWEVSSFLDQGICRRLATALDGDCWRVSHSYLERKSFCVWWIFGRGSKINLETDRN